MAGSTRDRAALAAFAVVASGLVAGCAGPAQSRDVLANPDKYMQEKFAPERLSPAVRSAVEKTAAAPTRFSTMKIDYLVESEEDGKKQETVAVNHLRSVGKGYVQSRTEFLRNDIAYRTNLALTVGNVHSLATQVFYNTRAQGTFIVDTRDAAAYDTGFTRPVPGNTYLVTTRSGIETQFANFREEELSCAAGEPRPASTVHASLTGRAVPLDCKHSGASQQVTTRKKLAWLEDYGVAVLQEMNTSSVKNVFAVKNISVTR